MSGIGNRSEEERQAIAESMGMEKEQEDARLHSLFIYATEGLPNDPAVMAAVDAWAEVWGNEIVPTMKDEGLYDETNPDHVTAMNKLEVAADKIAELLPGAKFQVGAFIFEGGRVELST